MRLDRMGTFIVAIIEFERRYVFAIYRDKQIPASRMPLLAAVGGSMATRTLSRITFKKQGRGMVTQDMLNEIGPAFAELFGDGVQGGQVGKAKV